MRETYRVPARTRLMSYTPLPGGLLRSPRLLHSKLGHVTNTFSLLIETERLVVELWPPQTTQTSLSKQLRSSRLLE